MMPRISPNVSNRSFQEWLSNADPTGGEGTSNRPNRLAQAAKFCQHHAISVAGQRLLGGNSSLPEALNLKALGTPESISRILVELGAGLTSKGAVLLYGGKDLLASTLETDIGAVATWATRFPRWLARCASAAIAAHFYDLSLDDVCPWLGRPDYMYPADCMEEPRPINCPSQRPGQIADPLERCIAAVLLGVTFGWLLPRLAYEIDKLPNRLRGVAGVMSTSPNRLRGGESHADHDTPLLQSNRPTPTDQV